MNSSIDSSDSGTSEAGETKCNASTFQCHLAIVPEEDGTFSAIVLDLPGIGSCGDTEEEAEANAREAVVGAIETFLEDGREIPWQDHTQYAASVPVGATLKWILVNA